MMIRNLNLLLATGLALAACAAESDEVDSDSAGEGVSLEAYRDVPVDHDAVIDKEYQWCGFGWVGGVWTEFCDSTFRQYSKPALTLNQPFDGDWQFTSTSPQARLANGVPFDMCPKGMFVYRFDIRQEASQGSGDDTALNSVILHCWDKANPAPDPTLIGSSQGIYGTWTGFATPGCFDTSNPMIGLEIKYENEFVADDVMGTLVRAKFLKSASCGAGGQVVTPPNHATPSGWGSWKGMKTCPAGQAICGMNTNVEASVGSGDDSMLNAIQIACCPF